MDNREERVNAAYDYAIASAPHIRERMRANENYTLAGDIKSRFSLTAWTAERLATIAILKNDGDWYKDPSIYDF